MDVSKVDLALCADRYLPTVVGAPPWFMCQRLRPSNASAACISACGPGGRGSRFRRAGAAWTRDGCGSTVRVRHGRRARFRHADEGLARGAVPDAGTGWEQDGARGMRCGYDAQELGRDTGLGPDVQTRLIEKKNR